MTQSSKNLVAPCVENFAEIKANSRRYEAISRLTEREWRELRRKVLRGKSLDKLADELASEIL